MFEKKIYKLKIDEEFKKLIPPLSYEESRYLEENIVRDGCREPICVWNHTIIDGHNRYEICHRNNIPFYIQNMEFSNRAEAQNWICVNQLGRRNITEETRKYLIGKRYQMEKLLQKNPTGKNQYSKESPEVKALKEERKKHHRSITAVKLAKEYNVSSRAIMDYGRYANSIDALEKEEPELISKILNGQIKIGQKRIIKVSQQSPKIKNKLQKHLDNRLKSYVKSNNNEKQEHKASVKDMPKYDPDAEIVSLTFTIPSWIGSMDRVLGKCEFKNTTKDAKEKLKKALNNLDFAIETMLVAMEESE